MKTLIASICTLLLTAVIPAVAQESSIHAVDPPLLPDDVIDSSEAMLRFAPRPYDPYVPPTQRSHRSVGAFIAAPSWSWHRGMPVVGEKPLHEHAYPRTENRIGWGAGLTLRDPIHAWSQTSLLQYRVDLGYHRISSGYYSDSGKKLLTPIPNVPSEIGARDRTLLDLDVVTLGGMIGQGFYTGRYAEPVPEYEEGGTLGEHGIVLLAGLAISWRAGSHAVRTLALLPGTSGPMENPQGYPVTNDGRTMTLYDGDVPDLNRLGVSLRGGLVAEFSLGKWFLANIGAIYEYELFPIAGEEWRMHRLAITTAIYTTLF